VGCGLICSVAIPVAKGRYNYSSTLFLFINPAMGTEAEQKTKGEQT